MLRGYVKDRDTTAAQKSVKHCMDMLAPLYVTGNSVIKIQDGQKQFYEFMVSVYKAMYEEPEDFFVFPAPYEKYMSERDTEKLKKGIEKAHVTDQKECNLRNTFQQAIQFYANFLYKVGLVGAGIEERTGAWMITKEKYADVLKEMNRIHEAKYNEKRLQVFARIGMRITESGDFILIVHDTYKDAMYGLQYLCKAPEYKYKYMNYMRLDYQNAYEGGPGVEDVCKVLPQGYGKVVQELESALAGWKLRTIVKPLRGIVSDFMWKVEYTYKCKSICGFYADHDYFMLCIHFNNFQNITAFAKKLQEEDEELFLWYKSKFPERLCKCPNNRRVFFSEEPRRICGLSNRAEVVNPSEDDVEKAIYILKKYREVV